MGRKYALASGLMEITYDTGAKVILQGPCTYEVDSAAGGFLSLGKLTARVEKNDECGMMNDEVEDTEIRTSHHFSIHPLIHLFSVRTPTAIVTDLGTEFGVEVKPGTGTEVHVFRGRVEAESVGQGGSRGPEGAVDRGEGGPVRWTASCRHVAGCPAPRIPARHRAAGPSRRRRQEDHRQVERGLSVGRSYETYG